MNCSVFDKTVRGIDFQIARAFLRPRHHLQKLTVAFEVDLVTVVDTAQRFRRTVLRAEDGPDRRIFRSETPDAEARGLVTAGRAHLVVSRDRVEKPDLVMRLIVFVVFEIRIARGRIESWRSARITRADQRFLKRDFV